VRDRGSASPRLLRATVNAVPCSPELAREVAMPLALVVQPLAPPDPADDPVPLVDLGPLGPLRCARCKAYINAFCRWTDGGKAYLCSLCGHANACPEPYYCYLGPDGRRRDADERAELSRGTYEIVASAEYSVRPPMHPTHAFVVDASAAAVATGATAAACRCVELALDAIQGGEAARCAVVAFDGAAVQFFHVGAGQGQPAMLVMPDVGQPYSPLAAPAQLAPVQAAKAELRDLLQALPGMAASAAAGAAGTPAAALSCGGAAIEAAVELLKPTGGKVHAFLAGPPTCGARAVRGGGHHQQHHASPANGGSGGGKGGGDGAGLPAPDASWQALAADAAEFNVCVDVFLLAQGPCDAANLSALAQTTGGQLYSYFPFNAGAGGGGAGGAGGGEGGDVEQLLSDLRWNVARPQGLEAILRVRASTGLDVEGYSGALYKPANSPTDVYLPAVDCDKAIVARLSVSERLTPGHEVVLQSALLYTCAADEGPGGGGYGGAAGGPGAAGGGGGGGGGGSAAVGASPSPRRRIRVSTIALPVSDAAAALFKAADLDAHLVVGARAAAGGAGAAPPGTAAAAAPLASAREGALSRAAAVLGAYRRHCATSSSAAQLILPEALKLLPLYTLALLKSPLLRADARADERAVWQAALMSGGCARVPGFLHARLLPFHRLYAAAAAAAGGGGGGDLASFVQAALPPARPLPLPPGAPGADAPRPPPLPDAVPLSSEALEAGGVYFAENGADALLFVDRDAPGEIVRELFGADAAPDAEALCRAPQCPPLRLGADTRAARLLAELLARARASRGAHLRLRVARRGDPQWEPAFGALLAEDRAPASAGGGMSYVEFLCHVHRQVQNRMG
jgi:protein transport protein SEC24